MRWPCAYCRVGELSRNGKMWTSKKLAWEERSLGRRKTRLHMEQVEFSEQAQEGLKSRIKRTVCLAQNEIV